MGVGKCCIRLHVCFLPLNLRSLPPSPPLHSLPPPPPSLPASSSLPPPPPCPGHDAGLPGERQQADGGERGGPGAAGDKGGGRVHTYLHQNEVDQELQVIVGVWVHTYLHQNEVDQELQVITGGEGSHLFTPE